MFYKITAYIENMDSIYSVRDGCIIREIVGELAQKSEKFFFTSNQSCYLFAVKVKEQTLVFGAITKDLDDMEATFWKYAKTLSIQIGKIELEEIIFKEWKWILRTADRNDFIASDTNVPALFGIDGLDGPIKEYMLENLVSKDSMMETANRLLAGTTLQPELERIYMGGRSKKRTGHPVHYLIKTDDFVVSEQIYKTLLSALLINGRIKSKRYCVVDSENDFSRDAIDSLFQSCENGAVIVRYEEEQVGEGRYFRGRENAILELCETVMRYKNKVLTVLLLPAECSKIRDSLFAKLEMMVFVELHEDVVFGEKAQGYLKQKAKEHHVSTDKYLFSVTEDKERGFCATELNRIFDEWYDHKLRFSLYPQYKEVTTVKQQMKKEDTRGSAFLRLQELIGLSEAKKVITQAINYYKAQKIYAEKGLKADRISMHMIFTGNPGTAKTTVARLFAQIMKENGMLSNGELHEVGRANLVGQYVGQTAPLVKRAFQKAKGGVLFIDEAYSLVDREDGLYGDEAINTIVQEMENHREDTIVIFAGYPDKMEEFLKKNPGLRSRIAFHIPFEDYNVEELCQIANLITRDRGLIMSSDAMEKLKENFMIAKEREDFGNGRYVRNLIEQAKMSLANRLIEKDISDVSNLELVVIHAEDIENLNCNLERKRERCIGFG